MTDYAKDALPGWRGTDPDGGTWVRLRHPRDPNWLEVRHDGVHVWRSQEEAEAAGLVPLYMVQLPDPLPAPLDPGNPEHLRQHVRDARAIEAHYGNKFAGFDAANWGLGWVLEQADRLDCERAEAEQDAADRKRAEEWANGIGLDSKATPSDALATGYLAGIRAGRAERQEAGQ